MSFPIRVQALRNKVLLPLVHWTSRKLSFVVTHAIARFLPEAKWYPATFRITRLLAAVSTPFVGEAPFRSAWMLHFWLKHLFGLYRPFHIPIKTVGAETLFEARANPNGVALLSLHVPLSHLILRSVVELGCLPDAVLANPLSFRDGKFTVGGTTQELPGLAAGSLMALVKARSVLQRGGMVAALIDIELGAPLNPNMLRLVGSVGARLVFALSEVQENGELLVRFYAPPDPFCRSSVGIESNIEFLKAKVRELMRTGPQPTSECLLPSAESIAR